MAPEKGSRPTRPSTIRLVLGVMTAPAAHVNRKNLRELSHAEPGLARSTRVVFVLGDVACAKDSTSQEASRHGDIVYVNSTDCKSWHRAIKVHAWWRLAVERWPRAEWYGKTEDDGLLRVSSLLRDLRALDPREPWYYGIMAFTAGCVFREGCPEEGGRAGATSSRGAWAGCCGGCFAGALQPYPREDGLCASGSGACGMPSCAVMAPGRVHARAGSAKCAEAPMAPFAIGPVEVRSRPLALTTAGCTHADRYMEALSRRGDALESDCASMDGAQAFTLTMCSAATNLADATWKRMSYPPSAVRNARGRNETRLAWGHPAKSLGARDARSLWHALGELSYTPAPLHTYRLEAPTMANGGGGPGGLKLTATGVVQPEARPAGGRAGGTMRLGWPGSAARTGIGLGL